MLRRLSLLLLLVGCEHHPAPVQSASPATSAAPTASEQSSTPAPTLAADAPNVAPPEAKPVLSGRISRFEAGKAPSVVISGVEGEFVVRGVDGPKLDWRVGDEIVVDGPKPEAGAVDCTEPARCSLGLRTGGDVVLADVDAHAAAPLVARMGRSLVVVGASRRARLELRATNADVLARSAGAAFGLGVDRYKSLTFLAPPALIAAKIAHVPAPSRKADLELRRAPIRRLVQLFADVAEVPMLGELTGRVSVVAPDVASGEVLDAVFGLCGVSAKREGKAFALTQQGNACELALPERHCPQRTAGLVPSRPFNSELECIDLKALEVTGLGFSHGASARAYALLGQGEPRGDEMVVWEGKVIDHSELIETDAGNYEINWRVSKIERTGVELTLADPINLALASKHVRLGVR